MRIFRNLFVLFFSPVGIFMLPLVSCEHKELCYDHSHTVDVRVVLDWKNAAEASPSSMRLYLFPQDGGGRFFRTDLPTVVVEISLYPSVVTRSCV